MNVRLPPHCHSQNSREFKCYCGKTHRWSKGCKQMVECECGRVHWRGRGAPENRRTGHGMCQGVWAMKKQQKKTRTPDNAERIAVQQVRPRIHLDFLRASTGCLLVVEAPTGIEWTQQTGGVACCHPVVEGYVIPLEANQMIIAELSSITLDHYYGLKHIKGPALKRLRATVRALEISVSDDGGEFVWKDHRITLDVSRFKHQDAGEAWIPVNSVLGKGWLTFENSD